MAYYIIGGDKRIYGPKPGRDISDWIREGRLNEYSRMSTEEGGDWRPLVEFREFAKELELAEEEYEEIESEEINENSDEFSLPVLALVWFIKIVIIWPIYWPCWLAYKIVYVALPLGLVLCIAGNMLDYGTLLVAGFLAVCGVGPIGLMTRFYVWAFNLRFGGHEG